MEQLNKFENEIQEQLNKIYGLGNAKRTIENYMEFVKLYTSGQIKNIGNFNLFITIPDNFTKTNELLYIIHNILEFYNIVSTPYKKINRFDMRKQKTFKENMLVIDEDTELYLKSLLEMMNYYICKNRDKIFVFFYNEGSRILNPNDRCELLESFTWITKIDGKLTVEDKINLIQDKLSANKIKVSSKCNFINNLANSTANVETETLYMIVKCRANKVRTITNDFLEKVHRKQYISTNKHTALGEMNKLVGLENVKQQIMKIVNYTKVSKNRNQPVMLNMVFNGPVGVGKTTMARLVGRLFAEENILYNENKFVEIHARDLVGKYVGWTAQNVKNIVAKAEGGVLFIDEAYSLFSERHSFEQEAVDTLIAEMENKRDRICIILAGYQEEMQQLLSMNPGFGSRISFHIDFEDYSVDELYTIFKQMCKNDGYKLDKNIKQLMLEHFEQAKKSNNFSNGRYVRNIFEHIKIEMATRLLEDETTAISLIKKCDVITVLEDIKLQIPKEKNKIGFTST